MRRHTAALLPVGDAVLPQVFLGGESQLLAFAAAAPELAGRLFFAALPEMFSSPASLPDAWKTLGQKEHAAGPVVHLRFGSIRDARMLKFARNAVVVAETQSAAPLTASHHPFASGHTLPAATKRVFVYGRETIRPKLIGGAEIPATKLPAACITADLAASSFADGSSGFAPSSRGESAGLELVSLADFRSGLWAAGVVPARRSRRGSGAPETTEHGTTVLVPWNLAHFGSIVPDLLERLASLRRPGDRMPRIVLMPFNYLGQTGMIRRLIASLRQAAPDPDVMLSDTFLARVSALSGLPALRRLSRLAWVDGNDPEHWWTTARLNAAGFTAVLIDPSPDAIPGPTTQVADDTILVENDTRYGALSFEVRLPSRRTLPNLLALTAPGRRPRRQAP